MTWRVEFLDDTVRAEMDALPPDMRRSFDRILSLIEGLGLAAVRSPHIEHLEGPLWEIRMRGRDGIARALYVTASGKRVVVVRAFVKKTEKTPRSEIDLALKRAKRVR